MTQSDPAHWDGVLAMGWPAGAEVRTARLRLEPLSVAHAEPMVPVLSDPALYTVIGGEPPDLDVLHRRYARLERPVSDDGQEGWLNWIVFDGATAVGTVQATVTREPELVGELAWVVGTAFQRRGIAVEAASAMVGWLRGRGVSTLRANVAPGHLPSEGVAGRLGLRRTDVVVDGELRWQA